MTTVTLIDNYDSFTWNLVHCLGALGAEVIVHRNDKVSVAEIMRAGPAAGTTIPIFGVCLGHQALGEAYGGEVIRAPEPVHGKLASIEHEGETVFHGLNGPFFAARYHSLVVRGDTMPDVLTVTAKTDGLVMGLSHKQLPSHGVQFHPESIASEHGPRILENFLALAAQWNQKERKATRSGFSQG
jgi:anthranilate synthase component 2